MKKWILFNFVAGFTVYWASNLLLWYPWSISTALGITLMLTVSPFIWAFSTFYCLKTYPNNKLTGAATLNAIVFLTMAAIMDYIFFGLIRGAMEDLYHPTTFYGYGFVVALPFIEVFAFGKQIKLRQKILAWKDFKNAGIIGLVCFGILLFIIAL